MTKLEELHNNFERPIADNYENLEKPEQDRMQWIKDNIVGTRVLDIGCSTGYLCTMLDEKYRYIGIDKDEKSIQYAKELHKHKNHRRFMHKSLEEMKFTDTEVADTIVASEVLEHLEDGLDYIPKLRKMCKRLIITVPNRQWWDWEHHKLTNLTEDDFKGAKIQFYDYREGMIKDEPILDLPEFVWSNILVIYDKDMEYGMEEKQVDLNNNDERPVADSVENLPSQLEKDRMYWIRDNILGVKVLDIGCSTGYLSTILDISIDYTGYDYNADVVEYAKKTHANNPHAKFIHKSLEDFEFTDNVIADTIIVAEVIEHLENGLDYIPKLRKMCNRLIVTVPYKEWWYWHHHKVRNITEDNFKGAKKLFYYENEKQFNELPMRLTNPNNKCNLFAIYDRGVEYETPIHQKTLTAYICTKGRYDTTLPLAMQSIIFQTVKPNKLIIVDDNPQNARIEYDKHPLYKKLMNMAQHNGIEFNVIFAPGEVGPAKNHQVMLNMCTTDLLLRVDDDDAYEPDTIEKLLLKMAEGYDAVAPFCPFSEQGRMVIPWHAQGTLSNPVTNASPQFFYSNEDKEVEHFTNTFMIDANKAKAKKIKYAEGLSPVGHGEETRFSHDMFSAGMKLCVVGGTTAWHYKYPTGGIRQNAYEFFWDADEREFDRYLAQFDYTNIEDVAVPIILGHGYGDNIMFMNVIHDVVKKYHDKQIIISTSYPEVFAYYDIVTRYPNVKIMGNHEISMIFWNKIKTDPIYHWMSKNKWQGHIIDAYYEIYVKNNIWDIHHEL